MLPTAEEQGLLGSEYYAANPLFPLATTVANINIDTPSTIGAARDFSIAGTAELEVLDRLIEIAQARGVRFTADARPQAGSFFRSDHFSLAKRGVPSISFKSGDDLVEGGTIAGQLYAKTFTAERYHQPADEFDPNWTFGDLTRNLGLLFELGVDLSRASVWPSWSTDSEFRQLREESQALRH